LPDYLTHTIPYENWKRQQELHTQVISNEIDTYLERREHQEKNPVLDFLFEYYSFPPSKLKKWSPGFGVLLKDGKDDSFNNFKILSNTNEGSYLNAELFPDKRKESLKWILNLLKKSEHKAPHLGCFGMHEWAMIYRCNHIRHSYLPLRYSKSDIAEIVEKETLSCTHYDAFRFFSEDAKPMNNQALTRQNFPKNEQPGCLHTNMDLYKWAYKMYPWISSNIIRESFLLALNIRTIDMRASPYDLSSMGLAPIKVETQRGKMEYVKLQKQLYKRAQPIRQKLIDEYKQLTTYLA